MIIQKAMGETIGKVVTRISFSEKQYCLWQREQLYVIVSLVRKREDITFVGEASETLSAIRELLNKKNQWDEYCQRIVDTSATALQYLYLEYPSSDQKRLICLQAMWVLYLCWSVLNVPTSFTLITEFH